MLRIAETLDKDRKTINTFSVPYTVSLDEAVNKQNKEHFRALYFVSSRPVTKVKNNE